MTGGVGGEQGSDEMPETDAGHRPQREERVRTHLRIGVGADGVSLRGQVIQPHRGRKFVTAIEDGKDVMQVSCDS